MEGRMDAEGYNITRPFFKRAYKKGGNTGKNKHEKAGSPSHDTTSHCQFKDQGPVVQSIVSYTSSFRGQLIKYLRLYNQIH